MEVSLLLVLTGSWLLQYKRWGSEQVGVYYVINKQCSNCVNGED